MNAYKSFIINVCVEFVTDTFRFHKPNYDINVNKETIYSLEQLTTFTFLVLYVL